MKTIEEIGLELQSINDKYQEHFIEECQTDKNINHVFNQSVLLRGYETNLENEIKNTILKYYEETDINDRQKLAEIYIREGKIKLEKIFKELRAH